MSFRQFTRIIATLSLIFSLLLGSSVAHADSGREFLLSCTYGVLAGALVGAATLAVEDNPGDKIHRVARGASLGLYSGILLGIYVVYVVPAQIEAEQKERLDEQFDKVIVPDDYGRIRYFKPPKVTLYPVIEYSKVTGAALNYNVMSF